jgi:hypothetical protein
MKNLLMRGIILAFLMVIFGCAKSSPTGFKANSEPDGFGNIKWGAGFSEVKSDMQESRSINEPTNPSVKIKIYYTRRGDSLKLGEAQLEKIEYVFWKEKFLEARIAANGPENFDLLKKWLLEKYGPVEKSHGAYSWDGTTTQLSLTYDEAAKTALVVFASTQLASQDLKALMDSDK